VEGEIYDSPYGYPFMKQSKKKKVYGELYQIDKEELELLDALEDYRGPGERNLYDRVLETVYTDARSYQAYAYVMPKNRSCEHLTYIECGDWSVYRQLKKDKY
jgi:gamma-glutamylcyclotransferase (GGCT)/AIG2-like uncharacterized protein YtfP